MRFFLLSLLFVAACTGPTVPFPDTDDTDPTPTDTDDTDPPTPVEPIGDPEANGPYTLQFVIDDIPAGEDELRSRIFIPSAPSLGPVALIFPAFLLSPEQYDSYAEHLASHGYVAMIVNLPGGFGENRKTHAEQAAFIGTAIDWLQGQSTTRLAGIDPDNVWVMGHSLGGKLALLRATSDARIKGIVALDPVDVNPFDDPVEYPSVTPELMGQLQIPVAYLGETNNGTGCAPTPDNFDAYYGAAAGPALRVQFTNADHVSWLDNPDCGVFCNACEDGTDDPVVTKRITRGVALSFFEHVRLTRPGARDHFTTLTPYVTSGDVTVATKNDL